MRALFSAALLAWLPFSAHALETFTAEYTADAQQAPISGSALRSLQKDNDGVWTLRFQASLLVATLEEESRLQLNNGRWVPLRYQFERSGFGKAKSVAYLFDWQAKTVSGHYRDTPINLPLKAGLLDKSSYQLALQHDLATGRTPLRYDVLDGDKISTYDFRVIGTETVKTGVGTMSAVHVERVRENNTSNRRTELWFAPEWDHLLVRLMQRENDGKEYQIMLQKGRVGGRVVTGH